MNLTWQALIGMNFTPVRFSEPTGQAGQGFNGAPIAGSTPQRRRTSPLRYDRHAFIMLFSRLAKSFQRFREYVCPAFSVPGFRLDVQRIPRLNTLEGNPSEMRYARHGHEFNGVNPVQRGPDSGIYATLRPRWRDFHFVPTG